MMRRHLVRLAVSIAAAVIGVTPAFAWDAPEAITHYRAVYAEAAPLSALFDAIHDGEVPFAAVADQIERRLAAAEAALDAGDRALGRAPGQVSALGSQVSRQVALWHAQFEALERGDKDGYDALLRNERRSVFVLLDLELASLEARRDAEAKGSAGWYREEAARLSTEALGRFLTILHHQAEGDPEENRERLAGLTGTLGSLAETIDRGRTAGKDQGCYRGAFKTAGDLLEVLKAYEGIAEHIVAGDFTGSDRARLSQVNASYRTLTATRDALRQGCPANA